MEAALCGRIVLIYWVLLGANNRGQTSLQRLVASLEKESVDNLDKQEMAFKIIGQILDKVQIDQKLLEQVRNIAKEQIQSMLVFLKIQKCDWSEPKSSLKVRINTKLSVYQAAARLQIKCLTSIDSDGKLSKRLLHGTLALLIEAAEACIFSVWRKLKVCEELFSSLLAGISQIALTRGGQLLRVLLIRFKPLVLAVCAQSDTRDTNHGAMFKTVLKTSCEIIEFGWSKDRSPVDTFIMGLATSIRERYDYEEEAGRERQAVPTVKLNVIHLLADMNVSLNKSEVVDTILPLFVESLEEGDASTPGLLRLRLLDALSCLASLGFEKSYCEALVLMTRSYLSKLSSIGSAESKTMVPEATTERVETLPSGFLIIARGLTNAKLWLDYRNRLLSLCSDVGLAAESKSGSGADVLGPLLPSVAEICSDFDPTVDMEPLLEILISIISFLLFAFYFVSILFRSEVIRCSLNQSCLLLSCRIVE